MPENTENGELSEQNSPEEKPAEGKTADNKTLFDLDYVKTLRSESAGYRSRLREAETARDEAKTALEAAEANNTKVSELESNLNAAQLKLLRYNVAISAGLPMAADRLVGTTKDEIEADLVRYRKEIAGVPFNFGQAVNAEPESGKADPNSALRALFN